MILKDCHGSRIFREKRMLLDCEAMYVVCTRGAGGAWQGSKEPPMAILQLQKLNKNNMKLKLEALQGVEGKSLRW
jgi:hypothetical protein